MMGLENLVGLILPPFIDMINKHVTDVRAKYLIALGVSVVVGVLVNLPKLKASSPVEILGSIAIVATAAQLSYKLYWEQSDIRKDLLSK